MEMATLQEITNTDLQSIMRRFSELPQEIRDLIYGFLCYVNGVLDVGTLQGHPLEGTRFRSEYDGILMLKVRELFRQSTATVRLGDGRTVAWHYAVDDGPVGVERLYVFAPLIDNIPESTPHSRAQNFRRKTLTQMHPGLAQILTTSTALASYPQTLVLLCNAICNPGVNLNSTTRDHSRPSREQEQLRTGGGTPSACLWSSPFIAEVRSTSPLIEVDPKALEQFLQWLEKQKQLLQSSGKVFNDLQTFAAHALHDVSNARSDAISVSAPYSAEIRHRLEAQDEDIRWRWACGEGIMLNAGLPLL